MPMCLLLRACMCVCKCELVCVCVCVCVCLPISLSLSFLFLQIFSCLNLFLFLSLSLSLSLSVCFFCACVDTSGSCHCRSPWPLCYHHSCPALDLLGRHHAVPLPCCPPFPRCPRPCIMSKMFIRTSVRHQQVGGQEMWDDLLHSSVTRMIPC